MEFPGNFIGIQNTANTNHLSGVHSLYEVGQGVSDGTWPTNYKINQSLRFENASSSYLSRSVGDGNPTTFTVSGWYKRTGFTTTYQNSWSSFVDNNNYFLITVSDATVLNESFRIQLVTGGTETFLIRTSAIFRDYSQWYHFVVAINTNQLIESDRAKIYINGELITEFNNVAYPTRDIDTQVNGTSHYVGTYSSSTQYFDGYIAEVNFIDGLQLDASYFGSFHPTTGQWLPKKYTGEYGSTGYYLDFAGTNTGTGAVGTVGEDKSGNDNHFSSNGISSQDVVPDSPTNNFCMFDRQNFSTGTSGTTATLTNGNLTMSGGGNNTGTVGTIAVPPKGQWYMEIRTNDTTLDMMWGGAPVNSFKKVELGSGGQWNSCDYGVISYSYAGAIDITFRDSDGNNYHSESVSETTTTTGDVLGYSFDFDNGEVHIFKNGTHKLSAKGWVPADDYFLFGYQVHSTWPAVNMTVNWGQDPTFNGTEGATATDRIFSDANGFGKFLYEPPIGAMAICSENVDKIKNRPTAYISDETNKHIVTYNGNAKISQFSPYITGGYSAFFGGSPERITAASDSSLAIGGTDDYTVETWVYFNDTSITPAFFQLETDMDSASGTLWFGYYGTTNRLIVSTHGSGTYLIEVSWKPQVRKWYHVAAVRTSGSVVMYIDGVAQTTYAVGSATTHSGLAISQVGLAMGVRSGSGGTFFKGYLTDTRFINGSAVVPPEGGPKEPLTAVTNTQFLFSAKSNRFIDSSSAARTLTATGTPEIADLSPYVVTDVTQSDYGNKSKGVTRDLSISGGSFEFDGTTDFLRLEDSADFNLKSLTFTMECWIYPTGTQTEQYLVSKWDSAKQYRWYFSTAHSTLKFEYDADGGTSSFVDGGTFSTSINLNAWTHLALVSNAGTTRVYVNGVDSGTTGTVAAMNDSSDYIRIGGHGDATTSFVGKITDFRIVNGKAVYTSNFTPTTTPLTQTSKTVLLLQPYFKVKKGSSNYKNIDSYNQDEVDLVLSKRKGGHVIVDHGEGAKIFDTSPYSKGDDIGSFVFDGLDDKVVLPTIPAVGTSDWTLEYWMNERDDVSENYSGLVTFSATADAKRIGSVIHSGTLHFLINGSWLDTSFAPTTGKWHHIAIVRDKDTRLSMFVDGIQKLNYTGAAKDVDYTEDFSNDNGGLNLIGSYSNINNVLITDVRFTKQVLYTGSGTNGVLHFTPPRYPLSTDKYVTDGTNQSATGPSTTTTYTVTVASGTKYDGTSGNRYLIDGEPFDTVTLHRGSTYRFDVSDSSFGSNAHPFRFSSNENNSPSAAYTTGVTTSGDGGSSGAYVEIVVANDAPDNLYYYCTNHGGMGGTINVQGGRTITAGNALMLLQPGKRDHKSEVFEFASMNKLNYAGANITIANNGYSVTSTQAESVHSSHSVSSGKWYVERSGNEGYFGVQEANTASPAPTYNASMSGTNSQGFGVYGSEPVYVFGGNGTSSTGAVNTGYSPSIGATDVRAMAIDMDSSPKTVKFYVNNTRIMTINMGTNQYVPQDGTTGTAPATFADITNLHVAHNGAGAVTLTGDFNFGQDPTMGGHITPSGGTNADSGFPDEDGRGSFRYAPPSGYKAIGRIQNPKQVVSDAAQHPEDYFQTVTYTGSFPTPAVVKTRFKPGLIWLKSRTQTYSHYLYDMVRKENGSNGDLQSDATNVEADGDNIRFDDDGFASLSGQATNEAGQGADNMVAWIWKGGDTIVSNTRGNIPSVVSANQEAGFSIVSFVGNSPAAAGDTVGHGLTKAPEVVIIKARETGDNWLVGHSSLGWGNALFLDLTSTSSDNTAYFNDTAPTSSVFTISTSGKGNDPNKRMIAYCWHTVPGYSKMGKYVGNGNAYGPFVFTGFKPALIILKKIADEGWMMIDSKRSPLNVATASLSPNSNGVERTDLADIDFLSNGFKLRGTDGSQNTSGSTYIYMAWAESPFTRTNAI